LLSLFNKIDRSTQKLTTSRIQSFDIRHSLFDIRFLKVSFMKKLQSPINLATGKYHPVPSIQNPASSIKYPASSIKYPASSIEPPASRIQHRESSIENPVSSIEYPAPSKTRTSRRKCNSIRSAECRSWRRPPGSGNAGLRVPDWSAWFCRRLWLK